MAYENLTTYTETDPNSRITVTTNKAAFDAWQENEDYAYVVKDFGANYFNALDIDLDINTVNTSEAWGGAMFTISNSIARLTDLATTDCSIWWGRNDISSMYIGLWRGAQVGIDALYGTTYGTRYLLIERSAGNDTISCKIYSNSARTTLEDTVSLSSFGTATRYRYAMALNKRQSTNQRKATGHVENIDLNVATGTNIKINISDTFKDVSEIKINVADSWKSVTSIKQNIADVWKNVF